MLEGELHSMVDNFLEEIGHPVADFESAKDFSFTKTYTVYDLVGSLPYLLGRSVVRFVEADSCSDVVDSLKCLRRYYGILKASRMESMCTARYDCFMACLALREKIPFVRTLFAVDYVDNSVEWDIDSIEEGIGYLIEYIGDNYANN